jgi:dipeptidyl aminopeptidase/acylaminoacyl peptidase
MSTRFGAFIVTLGIIASAAAATEPARADDKSGLIARKTFFGNPDKSGVEISPDGKQISYLAPVNGVMNVFVGPIDHPELAKAVTKDTHRGIRQYLWAYTNKHILYLQDEGGNENFHFYRVNLADNDIKDLTPEKNIRALPSGLSHKFPNEGLVGINDRDPRFHDIYRVNLETGVKKLVQKNPEFAGFMADDDFRIRFAFKYNDDGTQSIMKPEGEDGWKEFQSIPMADSLTTQPVGFDKTGNVAYVIDSRNRDTGALTTLDLRTGKQTILAEDTRCDAGSVMEHPTEKTIQAVAFTYDRTRWEFKDPAVKADFDILAKIADGDVNVTSRSLDDTQWIVGFLMDNGPVRYYRYDRGTKKATFLFTNRKEMEGLALQKMYPRIIPSRDGMDLVCYLTLPPGVDDGTGKANRPVPLVLLVHGGPWARDGWGLNPNHQFLANRGYAVLSVNYRGSTGFGKKYVNAGNKEWAGKMHLDLIDAVDWAIKEKIAMPDKVAIMGGSYGGYATLVGVTFTPDKFACGVDIVGPSSIVTLLNTIPPYWAPAVQLFKDRVGDHTTAEGKKFLEERSPLSRVAQIKKPLLIGQGANDPRVKQSESDQIVKAMKEKNVPVTYVLFPDEGHGFARPNNSLAFNAVTEAFLAKQLGGRFEPIGDSFTGSTITVPNGADDVPGLSEKLPATNPKKTE